MKLSWLTNIIGSVNTSALYDKSPQELLKSFSNCSALNLLNDTLMWFSPHTLYSRFLSTSVEALEHIIYVCVVYLLVCLLIYKITFLSADNCYSRFCSLLGLNNNIKLPTPQLWGRVLFVISHPDDECMFFGPLIHTLTQRDNCQVYVLCLSNGNFEQQSQLRRQELWCSCNKLGIPSSNIILINATHLPDDPNVEWKPEAVAKIILNTAESLDIQAIITFDRDGVSQHPNHCAVYYAAASLCLANLLPKGCKFYTLDSVNIFRKYISILDLLCTCFMSTYWCILSWKQSVIIRCAMKEHKSQMKWFRWLYICFSRYMIINSVREVNLSDVELEMQIHEN